MYWKLHAFEELTNKRIPYRFVDRRPGDVAVSYANPAKANEELNWIAQRGIEEMCVDTWHWEMNRLGVQA